MSIGVSDCLDDALDALSLPAGQVDTTMQACLQKAINLRTSGGGIAPRPATIYASESLRIVAATQLWRESGLNLVFSPTMPTGRFYLLPEADAGVILHPIDGITIKPKFSANAAAGWVVEFDALAAEAPAIRSSYVVRGTI